MTHDLVPTRRQSLVICFTAAVTVLACVALCAAAILVPAPKAVAPLVACCCVSLPLLMSWELPRAVANLHAHGRNASALAELRRRLDELPEVEHPLGH